MLKPAIKGISLFKISTWCNMPLIFCLMPFVPGSCVVCTVHTLCSVDLEVSSTLIHTRCRSLCLTHEGRLHVLWDRLVYYCTPSALRGTQWNVMCSTIFTEEIVCAKNIPQFRRCDTDVHWRNFLESNSHLIYQVGIFIVRENSWWFTVCIILM